MNTLHTVSRALVRIASVFACVFMLSLAASAYTVVMRGGKRVEIPMRFIVTSSTLTYEVSPGIQITLAVAAIDIAATEKANNELPGSFMRRHQPGLNESSPKAETVTSTQRTNGPRHTITNRDLESSMLRRRNSELAYESRRKQLGLPSVEESRRQAAKESALISRELEQTRDANRESEGYWRARASALRTEIAAVDAELGYVRRQLDESPFANTNGSFTTVTSVLPFGSFGHFDRGDRFPRSFPPRPGIFVAPHGGAQLAGRVRFGGGTTRGRVFINPLGFPHSRPFTAPLLAPPNLTVFGSTLPTYDISYERNLLITRFNELAATHAGLKARWRELEDEARRAGAPPGWLRP
jgi:hypothetical protein